jgi:hypothetical protein
VYAVAAVDFVGTRIQAYVHLSIHEASTINVKVKTSVKLAPLIGAISYIFYRILHCNLSVCLMSN